MNLGVRRMLGGVLIVAGVSSAFSQSAISVADTNVVEGDSGVTNAEFVVSLGTSYTNEVTVHFTTFEVPYDYLNEPYPARSGADFIATNGILTYAPGETNKSVFVQVLGDTINEANERFGLMAELYTTNDTTAVGYCTILDDDPLEITVNDCIVVEGTGGTAYANLTLSTHQTTEQTIFGVSSQQAGTGTATAGSDYPFSTGGVQWQLYPGGPKTDVSCGSIPIFSDATNEDDETFLVNVGLGTGRPHVIKPLDTNPPNARGVVFLKYQATVTIINDDFYLGIQPQGANRTQLTLVGASNATHVLQSSSDLVNWISFSTNTLGEQRQVSVVVTNNGVRFYRALRVVNPTQ